MSKHYVDMIVKSILEELHKIPLDNLTKYADNKADSGSDGDRASEERDADDIELDEQLRWNDCGSDAEIAAEEPVYRDTPLIFTADSMKDYTPHRYIEMRRMDGGGGAFYSGVKLFYKQAEFMESFEDDYSGYESFSARYPTYRDMTIGQLRTYFTWRTKVRRGEIEKTDLSYVYLYIYELINLIGTSGAEEGYQVLSSFVKQYSENKEMLPNIVFIWLRDYVVYYGLAQGLILPDTIGEKEKAAAVLYRPAEEGEDALFEALCLLSGYNMKNSRFYKSAPEDTRRVVCDSYSMLYDNYGDKKGAFPRFLLGATRFKSYSVFDRAVFYEERRHTDCVFSINAAYRFRCDHGFWFEERLYGNGTSFARVTSFMRSVDCLMRQRYGFKPEIKQAETDGLIIQTIERAIDALLAEKKKAEREKVTIDFSKLDSIRVSALETQAKLTVEELSEDEEICVEKEKEPIIPKVENETVKDNGILTGTEREYLSLILSAGDGSAYLRSKGIMESVAVDALNEKLFDLFGDCVIEFTDKPEVVEDYREELLGMIK